MNSLTTTERWLLVKQLFQSAVELPDGERSKWIDSACEGDGSLKAEVESLIEAHEQPGSFLDSPAVSLTTQPAADVEYNVPVGTMLGRYEILRLLGRGGMGEVYRAKDTMLGREVAVKVLHSEFSVDPNRLRRFEQEARSVSALNHPNIITIHEFGQADGLHFIVSEFIDGETLRRRMGTGTVNPDDLLDIAIQTTNALKAAHDAGIVHRDIKPENIMVRPDGLVKVLDFGLAKLTEPRTPDTPLSDFETSTIVWGATDTGVILGTVAYMSPEQARGLDLDARTDLFSLGVVLYEMAAGCSPFARDTNADVIAAILEKEAPPLAQLGTQISDSFERVIGKSLNKARDERYQTADEMLADLKAMKSGETLRETLREPLRETWIESAAIEPSHLLSMVRRRKGSVALAIVALLVIAAGYFYWRESGRTIESIAVLPLTLADREQETDYLADAITESVINRLTRLSNLTVRPRNSVSKFKQQDVDPVAAGHELDVEAVLTGRIGRRNGKITIDLELIDVRNNRRLWGANYTEDPSALLMTQAQIAREVTDNLRLQLSADESNELVRRPTENAEAWQLYAQGRYLWNRRTGDDIRKAIQFFEKAVEIDPSFALAHAWLANCYVLGGNYQGSVHEVMSKARASALQALKLDETLAEAHAALAQVRLFYDWDFSEAERGFKRAIDLKPSYETAHHWYAVMLALAGKFPDAIKRIKLAGDLDPSSRIIRKDAGLIYYLARDYDAAIRECLKTLELSSDFYAARWVLGDAYLRKGRNMDAITELSRANEIGGGRSITKASLAHAYAVTGQRTKALSILDEMRASLKPRPVPAFYNAMVYAGLGDKDQAFLWLDKAYEEHAYRMTYLLVDPAFDSLRSDSRFDLLLQRVGLEFKL